MQMRACRRLFLPHERFPKQTQVPMRRSTFTIGTPEPPVTKPMVVYQPTVLMPIRPATAAPTLSTRGQTSANLYRYATFADPTSTLFGSSAFARYGGSSLTKGFRSQAGDRNADGVVDSRDFEAVARPATTAMGKRANMMDADADGIVSVAERRAAADVKARSLDESGDRSSKLTASNVPGHTSLYHLTKPMDTNDDGVLQHEEFMAALNAARARAAADAS